MALERGAWAAYRGDIDTGNAPGHRPKDRTMNRLNTALSTTPRFTAFACAALCTLMTVAGIDALAMAETAPLWLAHVATDTVTHVAATAAPLDGV